MAQNKAFIDPENITEWLASTGYLFPRNELELKRYNKLFNDTEDIRLSNSSVSIERILSGKARELPLLISLFNEDRNEIIKDYKMVARNGVEGLPSHIFNKMMNNQNRNESDKKEEDK